MRFSDSTVTCLPSGGRYGRNRRERQRRRARTTRGAYSSASGLAGRLPAGRTLRTGAAAARLTGSAGTRIPGGWSRTASRTPTQQRVTRVQSITSKVLDHLGHEQEPRGKQRCDTKADADRNQHEISRKPVMPATRVRADGGGSRQAAQDRHDRIRSNRVHRTRNRCEHDRDSGKRVLGPDFATAQRTCQPVIAEQRGAVYVIATVNAALQHRRRTAPTKTPALGRGPCRTWRVFAYDTLRRAIAISLLNAVSTIPPMPVARGALPRWRTSPLHSPA